MENLKINLSEEQVVEMISANEDLADEIEEEDEENESDESEDD